MPIGWNVLLLLSGLLDELVVVVSCFGDSGEEDAAGRFRLLDCPPVLGEAWDGLGCGEGEDDAELEFSCCCCCC